MGRTRKGKLRWALVVRAWGNRQPAPQCASVHPSSPTRRPAWPPVPGRGLWRFLSAFAAARGPGCCLTPHFGADRRTWSGTSQAEAQPAQAGSWQTAVLSSGPRSTGGSDGCYCLWVLLQNRWSRNAGRSACRGMTRHQIRYLFVSCVGPHGFEPGGRPPRRALRSQPFPVPAPRRFQQVSQFA